MTEKFVAGFDGSTVLNSTTIPTPTTTSQSQHVYANERVVSPNSKPVHSNHEDIHASGMDQTVPVSNDITTTLLTPDVYSPNNLNHAKPHASSGGGGGQKYMRPNPKLKPTVKSNVTGMNGSHFKMVSTDVDAENDDDGHNHNDNGNDNGYTHNMSSPQSKRIGSPKEKLLIIQEMIGTTSKK